MLRRRTVVLAGRVSCNTWRRASHPRFSSAAHSYNSSTTTGDSGSTQLKLAPSTSAQVRQGLSSQREDELQAAVRDHAAFHHQQNVTAYLGAVAGPHYEPQELLRNPPSPADVSLELLLASQAHLGHATSLWNPANSQYIFGIRDGIHIISLETTAAYLRRAAKVVEGVSFNGGLLLFVGTRKGQATGVVRAAELAGGCHLFGRWTPGSITNGQSILGSCKTKVVNELDQEVTGFEEQLGKRASLKPDLVICLNPMENYPMLHECALNNIPTIGVIDTNADPTWVTYPIPANDDSLRCAQVIAGVLGRAGEAGKHARLAAGRRGRITFTPARDLRIHKSDVASAAKAG